MQEEVRLNVYLGEIETQNRVSTIRFWIYSILLPVCQKSKITDLTTTRQ